MELEIQTTSGETIGSMAEGIAQLTAAAAQLERTAANLESRLAAGAGAAGGEVRKVVAAIDCEPDARIADLEIRLKAAEQTIAQQAIELRGQASGTVAAAAGRKTLPVAAANLLAKHGLDTLEQINGSALDTALIGLSLEQRIAVKSQLLRAGLLG